MRWLASAALAVALAVAPGPNVRAADPSVASPSDDSGRPSFHSLTIVILDGQTEEQISARCSVVDASGQPVYAIPAAGSFYHAPYGDSPGYFYSRGQSVLFVPAGPTEVTVARGFEYGTVVDTVGVTSDTTVTFHLDRWIDMNALDFYSGDCHAHIDHSGGVYTVEPDDALFMAQAEGLNVINCLDIQYFFTGGPDSCSTSDCIVYMGEEYRSGVYGHAGLLGLSTLVWPPSTTWWPLLMDVADEVHAQPGAAIICAHPVTTNDFFDIETVSGKSLARELPIDVIKYKIDGYELLAGYASSHRRTKQMWYRVLNCGFRLPACAGTDAGLSAAYGKPPGSYRVYVHIDGEFNYDSWLSNLVAGRTFVTNGPLFTELDVRDFSLGDSVNLTTQGVAYLDGHVRVECETPLRRLDIVCNGQIRETFFAEEGQCVIDTSFLVTVNESSWIAVRASGPKANMATVGDSLFAHSGPVYFVLNGARILETESAQELVEWVADLKRLVVTEGEWTDPAHPDRIFDEIDAASAFYTALASGAATGADGEQSEEFAASVARLEPARPNPFESDSVLNFSIPAEGHVCLSVYAPSGRLVRTLVDGRLPAGGHFVSWDGVSSSGRPCGSGVYLCRLECDIDVVTRKLVLMH
jgi:hypothetical protein